MVLMARLSATGRNPVHVDIEGSLAALRQLGDTGFLRNLTRNGSPEVGVCRFDVAAGLEPHPESLMVNENQLLTVPGNDEARRSEMPRCVVITRKHVVGTPRKNKHLSMGELFIGRRGEILEQSKKMQPS